jgi:hypothetical protein
MLERRMTAATELALHALELARSSGSTDALAVSISAFTMATRGTTNTSERLELAREMSGLAATTLDHVQLAGIELSACPLLEMGDVDGFSECGTILRGAAERLRHPFALAQAEAWNATLAALRGDFDGAEAHSAHAVSLAGHAPNFSDGHLAQIFSIRRAQGRAEELLDPLEHHLAARPAEMAWRAAWAATAAATNRRAAVTELLARVRLEFWPLPHTWTYPVTLAFLIEAAWLLGDEQLAGTLGSALAPWSGRCLVVTTATSCEGAVDHYLALAALCTGERQRGRDLLQRAVTAHEGLQSPHLVERSRDLLSSSI